MELVVQKATELGVAGIWPVVTDRTDAAARPALHGSRDERWARVASGAAEQCGRAVVPHLAPTVRLDGLVDRPFDGSRVALLETAGHPPLPALPAPSASALLLLVGPAGGFEPQEADRLRCAGFLTASLGPRILRAETAAVAAVAIAQAAWGDRRIVHGPGVAHDGPDPLLLSAAVASSSNAPGLLLSVLVGFVGR